MYKEILRSMDDASIFAIVAILIFTIFFAGLFVYVIRMKRSHIEHMAAIPLEENELESTRQ